MSDDVDTDLQIVPCIYSKMGFWYSIKEQGAGRWQSRHRKPARTGWYQTRDYWDDKVVWRAWHRGNWWWPMIGGWKSCNVGVLRWRGPRLDILEVKPLLERALKKTKKNKR